MVDVAIDGHSYGSAELNGSHNYLLPALLSALDQCGPLARRVFDLGCGNGSVAHVVSGRGYDVIGVDPSKAGIEQAQIRFPHLKLENGSAYEPLADRYGRFPVLYSLEVVEHIYAPRIYAKTIADLLEPGGTAIISTPYHGYWKNLTMALMGAMDKHFTALQDHGHIKFWSEKTLRQLLSEVGLEVKSIRRVGRIPVLAKSMLVVVQKPLELP
jgi:2-polyprenyl-3-methyl-5-hydroxy-6-metoxy-1,4-benzoquinol methylase